MQTNHDTASPIDVWLDHLRQLHPVQMLVHVGAGQAHELALYERWAVERLLLVEADADVHTRLLPRVAGHPGWHAEAALVAEQEATVPFHVTNNLNESATLPPSDLVGAWRNLKLKATRQLEALTLPALLARLPSKAPPPNWLVVDCLPALPVLRGAGALIATVDVVTARVGLDGSPLPAGKGATEAEVSAWMDEQGFVRVALEQEHHPAFGRALYVRAWKNVARDAQAHTAQLVKARDEQAKLAATRERELQALTTAKAEAERAVQESKAQLVALTAAKAAAEKLADDRAEQVQKLSRARDEQAKLAATRESELQQLRSLKSESDKVLHERSAYLEEVTAKKAAAERLVAEQATQIGRLTQERDEHAKRENASRSELQTQTNRMDEAVKSLRASEALVRALTEEKTAAEKLAADRTTQLQQITRARDEQAAVAATRQVELVALSKAKSEVERLLQRATEYQQELAQNKDAAERKLADHALQFEKLTLEFQDQTKMLSQQQLQIGRMKELEDANAKLQADAILHQARIDELATGLTRAEKLVLEQQTAIRGMTEEKRSSQAETLVQQTSMEELKRARIHAENIANDRAAQIEKLTRSIEQVNATLAETQSQIRNLAQFKVDAQKIIEERHATIDEIKASRELFERFSKEQATHIERLRTEVASHSKAAKDKEEMAASLSGKLKSSEQIRRDQSSLLAEQWQALRRLELRYAECQADVAQRNAEFSQLDDQLHAAETALSVIESLLPPAPGSVQAGNGQA